MNAPCSYVPNIVIPLLVGSLVLKGLWTIPTFGIPLIESPIKTVTADRLPFRNSFVPSNGSTNTIASYVSNS